MAPFSEKGITTAGSFCVGATAFAAGVPIGVGEFAALAGGSIATVLALRKGFGTDCKRTMTAIRKRVQEGFKQYLTHESNGWVAHADLVAADSALGDALAVCTLQPQDLARETLEGEGAVARIVATLVDALAAERPDIFGPAGPGLAKSYAVAVLTAGIDAARQNTRFLTDYRNALLEEMAQAVGETRATVRAVDQKLDTSHDKLDQALDLLHKLQANGTLPRNDAEQPELLALLADILEQEIPPQDIVSALQRARQKLQDLKLELVQLRGLVNEEPDIAPLLDRAQAALVRQDRIELNAVDDALAEIDTVLKRSLDAKRRDRIRVLEARANTAAARQRHLRAAELFAEAAAEAPQEDRVLWARLKGQQGGAAYAHGELHPGLDLLNQAAEAYRAALRVRTEQEMPTDWARTQNNLGNALRNLGERLGGSDGLDLLNQAAAAYRAALRVYTEQEMPTYWAGTQSNLGTALLTLGERSGGSDGLDFLNQAADAYRAALRVYTEQEMPTGWAATQSNLGNALQSLGARLGGSDGLDFLNQAAAAYRAALRVYTEQEMPTGWAATQNNLGNALRILGDRVGGSDGLDLLNQAAEAYRAALRVRTEQEMPTGWAMTQNNLGAALQALGARLGGSDGLDLLNKAAEAYRAALRVYTEQEMPTYWAGTQSNLGNALCALGERSGGSDGLDFLNQAAAAYRAALRVRTEQEMPTGWAITQNNLGEVLHTLGERAGGAEGLPLLNQAADAYRAALRVFTEQDMPYYWEVVSKNLQRTLDLIQRLEGEG